MSGTRKKDVSRFLCGVLNQAAEPEEKIFSVLWRSTPLTHAEKTPYSQLTVTYTVTIMDVSW